MLNNCDIVLDVRKKLEKMATKKLNKQIRERVLRNMFVTNYKRMWPYVKPYWFHGLLSLLLAIPIGSMDALIALSLKPYMDMVMIEKSLQASWYIPVVIVSAGIGNFIEKFLICNYI